MSRPSSNSSNQKTFQDPIQQTICPITPNSANSFNSSNSNQSKNVLIDFNDLPLLTPSKSSNSISDSESDSISDRFIDQNHDELDSIGNLSSKPSSQLQTPASHSSIDSIQFNQISLSEPGPIRNSKINRKRPLSGLVALRYRGGKVESEIGDEERGLLALDLNTYVNSVESDTPQTHALPPSALFPTLCHLSTTNQLNDKKSIVKSTPSTIKLSPQGLPLQPPKSEWPLGGTGPGKTSRGFIPGRFLQSNPFLSDSPNSSLMTEN